jgi:hypothetical protein
MKNEYIIAGKEAYICLRRKDGQAMVTIVDLEDIPRIEELNFKIIADYKKNTNGYYAVMNHILLHRFIKNAPKGAVVDHINHNTLDNRKCNLRLCTYSENGQNRKGATTRSKSGIRGVCYDKSNKNWIAVVRKEGQTVFRKTYQTMKQAETAAKNAREKYYTTEGQA